MTEKEKAKELCNNYLKVGMMIGKAKECASICVKEILNGSRLFYAEDYDYWKKVKQEINKL